MPKKTRTFISSTTTQRSWEARSDSWEKDYASSVDEVRLQAFMAEFQVAVKLADETKCTKKGDAQIETWSNADSVTPKNWFWRGLAQNQTATIELINLMLAQRSQLPKFDGSQLQSLIKPSLNRLH